MIKPRSELEKGTSPCVKEIYFEVFLRHQAQQHSINAHPQDAPSMGTWRACAAFSARLSADSADLAGRQSQKETLFQPSDILHHPNAIFEPLARLPFCRVHRLSPGHRGMGLMTGTFGNQCCSLD